MAKLNLSIPPLKHLLKRNEVFKHKVKVLGQKQAFKGILTEIHATTCSYCDKPWSSGIKIGGAWKRACEEHANMI